MVVILETAVVATAAPGVSDPDVALIRGIAAGDRDAHRLFYERHARDVLAYLVGRLGQRQAAEEILHDVMLDVWRAAARFRGESRVRTWLLSIAHNRACNEIRRQRRWTLSDDPAATAAAVGQRQGDDRRAGWRAEELMDLGDAVGALPDIHRAVLDLIFFHGLTVEETATVLEVAPGTVKSRLNRAKAQLRRRLGQEPASHV